MKLPAPGRDAVHKLLVSGSYDKRPVMLSARSSYVHLSAEKILALNPVLHAARLETPITLAHGSRETREFQRHPAALAGPARGGQGGDADAAGGLESLRVPEGDGGSEVGREMVRLTLAR